MNEPFPASIPNSIPAAQKSFSDLRVTSDALSGLSFATVLIIFTNFGGILNILGAVIQALFKAMAGLKIVSWFFYEMEYLLTSNKTFNKTVNLGGHTVFTVFTALAIFGGGLIAAAIAPWFFMGVSALEALVDIVRMFYFLFKLGTANDKATRDFYNTQVKWALLKVALSGIILTAVTLGMVFAPHFTCLLITAMAQVVLIVAALALLTMIGTGIFFHIKNKLENTAETLPPPEIKTPAPTDRLQHNGNDLLPPDFPFSLLEDSTSESASEEENIADDGTVNCHI